MSDAVVTSAEQADADWLTEALRASGALQSGRVEQVSADASVASWSSHARLRLAYSADAEGRCPKSLFLKICAGDHAVFGLSEVHYYTRDYRDCAAAPIPRCFDAAYRDDPRAYHLLLEDLSDTHQDLFQVAPTLEIGCATADALARLHVHHWGRQRLARLGHAPTNPAASRRYFAHVERGLEPLLREQISPSWRDALAQVFEHHERAMLRRAERDVGFTLVHGDVNPGNILAPRRGIGAVYLIDRQPFEWSLQGWLGASDLAYWMVPFWEPEHRRRLERPVLHHYHECLTRAGIDLSWEQLWWDYRFSIAQCIEVAVEWLVLPEDREGKRWLWEMELERAMAAYAELDCATLW